MSLARYIKINSVNDSMDNVMKGLTNEKVLNDISITSSDSIEGLEVNSKCKYNMDEINRMNNRNNMDRMYNDNNNMNNMNNMNSQEMMNFMDKMSEMKEDCMNNVVTMIDNMISSGRLVSRNELMLAIMKYQLATLDIALFLDTHPNDPNALRKHQEYCMRLDNYKKMFTVLYGPMDMYTCDNSGSWRYNEGPWPWKQEF